MFDFMLFFLVGVGGFTIGYLFRGGPSKFDKAMEVQDLRFRLKQARLALNESEGKLILTLNFLRNTYERWQAGVGDVTEIRLWFGDVLLPFLEAYADPRKLKKAAHMHNRLNVSLAFEKVRPYINHCRKFEKPVDPEAIRAILLDESDLTEYTEKRTCFKN